MKKSLFNDTLVACGWMAWVVVVGLFEAGCSTFKLS